MEISETGGRKREKRRGKDGRKERRKEGYQSEEACLVF